MRSLIFSCLAAAACGVIVGGPRDDPLPSWHEKRADTPSDQLTLDWNLELARRFAQPCFFGRPETRTQTLDYLQVALNDPAQQVNLGSNLQPVLERCVVFASHVAAIADLGDSIAIDQLRQIVESTSDNERKR